MAAFRSIGDIEQSLWSAGLGAEARNVAATARPTVLFVRQQVSDETLPAGTSKMGGDPDLPAGFAWPERPALADAEARAEAIRQQAAQTRRTIEDNPDWYPHFTPAMLDDLSARHAGQAAMMFATLPLAFVAQLNLAALSAEAGFPEDFPDTGLLSLFTDVRGGDLAVAWHDGPDSALARRSWPQALGDYFDTYGPGAEANGSPAWAALAKAERLHPFSALTVPHHWKYAFPQGSPRAARLWDWLGGPPPAHDFFPGVDDVMSDPTQADRVNTANFGDRLGGWPDDIQGPAESEMDGRVVGAPGTTPWRHIFSYGAEFFGETRTIPQLSGGDGNTFVIMHEDDLAARRFARARSTYQQT